ncbi:MAG: TonB-dependent receptor [Prevotellaceae bacterium]|jgi:iron complex outermembrane receptor protein|nr:TonB-dependent receptor [Prevotellaceae bacterium]
MRIKKRLILTAVFLQFILANGTYARLLEDSVQLDEVIVTGSRTETNLRNLPMSVTVVGGKTLENRLEQSLLPSITEEVPGLYITGRGIMGYGVSAGSAGGMKIRGVGGSPTTGVLLLIDGHPQYMGLMGHPLPDAYQSLMAERVEVVRGPASMLYGSNALGGVINIITKKSPENGIKTNLRAMYGSYNTVSSEVDNYARSGKFSSYLSLGYNHSDGIRENMNFNQYSAYGKFGYDFTSNWKAFADLSLTNFDASNPGAIDDPMIDSDVDVTRGVTSFSIENRYGRTSGAFKFFYNFGLHNINDGYRPGGVPLVSRFRSTDNMFGISLYQAFEPFTGNRITAGFDLQRFSGHAWNTFLDARPNADIAEKGVNDVAGYLNIEQKIFSKLLLNAGIRLDNNSQTGTEWVPQAGLSFPVSDVTVLKAIVSRGFRNPTIREMYMFPPQNPDLKPERLMNYELSFSQKLLDYRLGFDVNLFYLKGDNAIQTIMTDRGPLNVNTGEIENYGLELASYYRISPNFRISANYSWLNMEYKIEVAPEHKLYAGFDWSVSKWRISSGVQYIGNLYTSVAAANTVKDSFTLWNARLAYSICKTLELFVKGENLLSQEYEINTGYPMPKATVFGGVNLRL